MKEFSCLMIFFGALHAAAPRYDETIYADWGQSFLISQEIIREKTEHQDLIIFENERFGRVLALDGTIQLTEADEPIYHEMMAHVPLFAHEAPQAVLILGGGDGGLLREVLKHPEVQRVVLVDIDPSVIELSKTYFPKVSAGAFEDSRVQIVIDDASQFVKSSKERFDVILCDSTDPVGPGAVLFTSEFYADCKDRLTEKGIFVNQNGVPFVQKDELAMTFKNRTPHFKNVSFYVAPVPTYAGGFMAFGWASDHDYPMGKSSRIPSKKLTDGLFYYNPSIHSAAFALPQFMLKQIGEE